MPEVIDSATVTYLRRDRVEAVLLQYLMTTGVIEADGYYALDWCWSSPGPGKDESERVAGVRVLEAE